jgi:L-methionine (R)-S-oxide reductase
MAEDLQIISGSKKEQYETILPQVMAIIAGEKNLIANLANVAGALKEQFGWWWVGFYLVDGPDELVLGPFQGPVACTRIRKGKGVCGSSWQEGQTLVVADVEQFPGHIACSSASRSEIVVPIFKHGKIVGVLDVDSEFLNYFDETDKLYLEKLMEALEWPVS